ncbi:uncharacterized protein LOC116015817 [Ipomoea triloba]|uniref:uncharacterized protein LOC116015817 n=1 Tax=Ipomoea triloba TaxID=35885 RepID=UPI00125D5F53|nr:uncharacterized protein LOC116015817 [Ipomoea triloba]
MRDLLRFSNAASEMSMFGGKTVVLGGDFSFTVLRLTKNLCLKSVENVVEKQQVERFANWIATIGHGTTSASTEDCPEVDIPDEMLLLSNGDPIATIIESTFPMFQNGSCDNSFLESRAILAPTLDVVNAVNDYMSSMHEAESRTYLSCDSICQTDNDNGVLADVHTPEFLNGLKASCITNHLVGSPVMLLRNIDHSLSLCNGTRLVVTRLLEHVIEAKIMTDSHLGTRVLVPRMSMTPPRLPFKFTRRQSPLMLSYAMTINKSQGQNIISCRVVIKATGVSCLWSPFLGEGDGNVAFSLLRREGKPSPVAGICRRN